MRLSTWLRERSQHILAWTGDVLRARDGSRGPHYGPESFLLGVNLPWMAYGCDFGANAWQPEGGLAQPARRNALERTFARLQADGIRPVRWFMLCDGRAGILFDEHDEPLGLDPHFFTDVDAALHTALQHGVKLMFVLFDFSWFGVRVSERGVTARGRAGIIRDQRKRGRLLERIVCPIFERYGGESAIFAWDIVNEPDWATRGLASSDPDVTVGRGTMRKFLRSVVKLVHERTQHQATVGLASARWLDLVKGLGLDFYQVHWYDRLEALSPLDQPVRKIELDRPLVVGEFPSRDSSRSVPDLLDTILRSGYGGAMMWSAAAKDGVSDYATGGEHLAAWAASHRQQICSNPAAR